MNYSFKIYKCAYYTNYSTYVSSSLIENTQQSSRSSLQFKGLPGSINNKKKYIQDITKCEESLWVKGAYRESHAPILISVITH